MKIDCNCRIGKDSKSAPAGKNEKTVKLDIIFNKVDKLLTLILGYNIIITINDENLNK
jgi:hypothetical protein